MTKLRRVLGMGLLVALGGVTFALAPPAPALEADVGLAWLFRARGPRQPPAEVAVVAINRESARMLGQSIKPAEWPRTLHARLIDALAKAGARAVAFDLAFMTPARNPDDDRALATALERAGNVVLLDFLEEQESHDNGLRIERRLTPIPMLADAAAAHGPFPLPKAESVQAYWLAKPGAGWASTLPVLALRVFDAGGSSKPAAQRPPKTEESHYLDFYGPPRTIRTIDYHAVLYAAEKGAEGATWLRETFAGRAIFVGFSASHPSEQDRVRDDYRTVFSREDGLEISGVEIAATAFANLLEDRAPQPLPIASQIGLYTAWGVLLGGLGIALRSLHAIAAISSLGIAYLALAQARFGASAQWLPLIVPLLLQPPLAVLGGVLWHYVDERRERRRLSDVIHDLLPRAAVDKLLSRIQSVTPAEQELYGVFVITDIQGFTTISEGLAPAQLTRMLNDYFALIFPLVERNGGSVAEIDGDAMLAFWLAARPEPATRLAACLAATQIAALTGGTDPLPGWPRLRTRIGVHAGPIMLARVGASHHHEYQVVGDAANTASRVEGLSKHLETTLLATQDALADLHDLLTRPLGAFVLAGKSTPVSISEVLCRMSDASDAQRRLCDAFAEALEAYRSRQWELASARWSAILQEFPDDGPSRFYVQRARRHAAEPPGDDWDAVVRMATK